MSERESSTVEIAIDYIKERIESPFLMSFLVSWAIVNRDFVFYLLLAEEKDKYRNLSDWDFSSFVFGWYSPVGDSFIYPLLFGALITLFFSAISMSFSGARYSVTSFFKGFAQTQKSKYDNILEITKSKLQLEKLTTDLHALQSKRDIILKGLAEETAAFEKIKLDNFTHEKYKLLEFIANFASFHLTYIDDRLKYDWNHVNHFMPSCKAIVECKYLAINGVVTEESKVFEGFFASILLNGELFDLSNELDVRAASHLMSLGSHSRLTADTRLGRTVIEVKELLAPERLA